MAEGLYDDIAKTRMGYVVFRAIAWGLATIRPSNARRQWDSRIVMLIQTALRTAWDSDRTRLIAKCSELLTAQWQNTD